MDANRLEFAPPPEPAAVRGFVLAILAHLLLMIALTWGINWKREADTAAAEAELWSSVPQEVAPPLVVQAPPLPPPPVEKVTPPPPVTNEPDIALEREKKRRELAKQREQELEQQKKLEARKKLEDEKRLAQQKAAEERKRREAVEQQAAEKKKKAEELAKTKSKQDESKLAALRKENLDRMMKGLEGGTGAPTATGSARRSTGPSASYAGRIAARIKPNIVFSDVISGNPEATIEIRVAPDGSIVGRKLVKSSGVKSWDDAVLRAIDKTEVIPRDTDGSVVPQFPISFRPRD